MIRLRHSLPLALFCLLVGLSAVPHSAPAQGQSLDLRQIERDLSGKYGIQLKNGSRQIGRVVAWDGKTLRLEVELGGGSAEMQFAADEIRDVVFPGEENLMRLNRLVDDPERTKDALAIFRALYKQRGPYIEYLDANELNFFDRYARYAMNNGEPLMAVSIINVLRPHIEDEARIRSLEDALLLSFFLAGMREEAETQARKWIEAADPAGSSALGWRILAEIHFQEERYETALWTALYPVTFSTQMPMEHLDTCYAFAVAAAGLDRQPEVQVRLYREMLDRGLSWPAKIPALDGLEPSAETPVEPVEAAAPEAGPAPEETPDEASEAAEPSTEAVEPPEAKPTFKLPSRI